MIKVACKNLATGRALIRVVFLKVVDTALDLVENGNGCAEPGRLMGALIIPKFWAEAKGENGTMGLFADGDLNLPTCASSYGLCDQ